MVGRAKHSRVATMIYKLSRNMSQRIFSFVCVDPCFNLFCQNWGLVELTLLLAQVISIWWAIPANSAWLMGVLERTRRYWDSNKPLQTPNKTCLKCSSQLSSSSSNWLPLISFVVLQISPDWRRYLYLPDNIEMRCFDVLCLSQNSRASWCDMSLKITVIV